MQSTYENAEEFAKSLGENLVNLNADEFLEEFNSEFYGIDDSLVKYLQSIAKHNGKFAIHHNKLIKYGILNSNKNEDIESKLAEHGMKEGEDYIVNRKKSSNHRTYYLTPETFKICLMRESDEALKYFLLIEECFLLYGIYRKAYSKKTMSA